MPHSSSLTIGILGGISPASTRQYYETLIAHHRDIRGDAHYPEIVIVSLDFEHFTNLENAKDEGLYVAYISEGIRRLERAGADVVILAANSPHTVLDALRKMTPLPILSIVDATAKEAARLNLKRVLLLGIGRTMASEMYPRAFAERDIDVVIPTEADRIVVNDIIFEELVVDVLRDDTRSKLRAIIDRYIVHEDIDGVILGCTELPLILQPKDCDVPLLDTLTLHARAAIEAVEQT